MKIVPVGEPIKLKDLPEGSLFQFNKTIAVKSEYYTKGGAVECAIVGSGERFWGGTSFPEVQRNLMVQPLEIVL